MSYINLNNPAISLAETPSPLGQTFRIIEENGVHLTGVGLFFSSKPTDTNLPITIELRSVTEDGAPSSQYSIAGSKVSKKASEITTVTSFDGSTGENKFTFDYPIFIPGNVELALVIYTNAAPDDYKIWLAELGKYEFGTTESRITSQPELGSFFVSSNNTTWTADQNKDIAFKMYKAKFTQVPTTAKLLADVPPLKALEPSPLIFTAADSDARVLHPGHGFLVGDVVTLSGLDSTTSYNGILGSSINGDRTISAVDPYGYTVKFDSAADSSVKAGGLGMFATDQYVIDAALVRIPHYKPNNSFVEIGGDFYTHKSFAGNQTPYTSTTNVSLSTENIHYFKNPFVLASEKTETNSLSGNESVSLDVYLSAFDSDTAPFFNASLAQIEVRQNHIDNSDSAAEGTKNAISTYIYNSETSARNSTGAAKHVATPVLLATSGDGIYDDDKATSIRVLVDASVPSGASFTIWYRTGLQSEESVNPLNEKSWTAFSKVSPNSNYDDFSVNQNRELYAEYKFNVYDIPDFDAYQIKITMHTTNSAAVPTFKNLRTIATI
jgi:hypothetical protein